MICELKCSVCNEIMGTVEKTTITEEDRTLYRDSTVCSNGHEQSTEIEEIV